MKVKMEEQQAIEVLIQKARNGDRDAFELLIDRCRPQLETHIEVRIGNFLRARVDVEDVLQETHIRAWKSIASFRGTGEPALIGWCRRIAEHVILDLADRHRRDQVIYLEEPGDHPDPEISPSKGLRREERFARLEEALESLSPEYREALTLVRIKGLKITEAADRMGRTPSAVTHLLMRALKKLKDSFGDTESLNLPPMRFDETGSGHEQ